MRNLQPTTKDVGGSTFNRMFWDSPDHILKRVCSNCRDSHREIYYKRLTKLNSFDLYSYTDNWRSRDNVLGKDFNLYSTYEDAINNRNRWRYCNYDDQNIGMFRDCGPNGAVAHEWTSRVRGGDAASFYLMAYQGLSFCNRSKFGYSSTMLSVELHSSCSVLKASCFIYTHFPTEQLLSSTNARNNCIFLHLILHRSMDFCAEHATDHNRCWKVSVQPAILEVPVAHSEASVPWLSCQSS